MMLIANGYVKFKQKTGEGLDENTGYPIPPSITLSNPVPCQFVPIKHDNTAMSNGEAFTLCRYRLLFEEEEWDWSCEVIELYTQFDRLIGEFSVIAAEHLKAVCQTSVMI